MMSRFADAISELRKSNAPSPAAAVAWLTGLGIMLRLWHFSRFPSIWHDEAVVLINAMRLDFRDMFGPLIYHEAAPPLFLMAERSLFLLFGDSPTAFRLLPLLASGVAMIIVALLAWRTLPPTAAVWAVALFATSDRLLYHAIEAKPYSLDVALAAAIAYGYVSVRHWPLWKQYLVALPIFPALFWFSFPACFVIGGWFVAQSPALVRSRCRWDWLTAIVLAAAVTASFLVLILGPVRAQQDASMESCWTLGFPNWQRPRSVPIWFVRSTLDICCYCLSPQGWALAGMMLAGAAALARSDRRLLLLLATPLVLALSAAMAGKYPYCGMRVLAFMTPALCILTALGIGPFMAWLGRRGRMAVGVGWIALAIPFIHTGLRIAYPWGRADTQAAAEYVLAHWQPGDRVGFNNWEGEYYFRDLAPAWLRAPGPNDTASRLWYVAVAGEPVSREAVIQAIPAAWQPAERREFNGVTTVLFMRHPLGVASTSARRLIP